MTRVRVFAHVSSLERSDAAASQAGIPDPVITRKIASDDNFSRCRSGQAPSVITVLTPNHTPIRRPLYTRVEMSDDSDDGHKENTDGNSTNLCHHLSSLATWSSSKAPL